MRKRTILKLTEYQADQSAKHLDEMRSIHREMRGYKHDFHNHLQVLRAQLENGEAERALKYIDELDAKLLSVDTLMKTGNVALDAILSGKISQAKSKNIEISVKANVPDALSVSDVELSIVIGNLLDNALEACESAAEPFIHIFIGMKGKMLYFHMMNSAGKKKPKLGRLFRSGKDGLHGFGLHRAESVVDAHGGWVKYNSEDGAFTSEFLVPAVE